MKNIEVKVEMTMQKITSEANVKLKSLADESGMEMRFALSELVDVAYAEMISKPPMSIRVAALRAAEYPGEVVKYIKASDNPGLTAVEVCHEIQERTFNSIGTIRVLKACYREKS